MLRLCLSVGTVLTLTACQGSERSGDHVEPEPAIAAGISAGQQLAAACSGCHSASEQTAIPSLKNHSEADLIRLLGEYRDETSGTTVMHRLARGYSDEDISSVSAYLAGQTR